MNIKRVTYYLGGQLLNKYYELKTGEKIIVMEELRDWKDEQSFYKVQRENGETRVINQVDFLSLINHFNSQLTTRQKVELFYSYFRGRQDVYAVKWVNKIGREGFSPHGDGEWVYNNNAKPVKKIHTYYPYTLATVEQHIRGEHEDFKYGVGIYPMLKDDTTYLVVIDFDSVKADEEVKAVIKTCQKFKINYLLERSQSGEGIHIWFFFQEPILASLARQFANGIIQQAMISELRIDFTSFDRIIPMQDTLPKNGFGNIIALPLRTSKVLEGKTVFLDDDLKQVPDLWLHLARITKYNQTEIRDFIQKLIKNVPLTYYQQNDSERSLNLPSVLKVILGGELLIKKEQLSRKTLVELAKKVTIHNPEFYLLQNMRSPTWNIPQFITTAREDENYLYLPRGFLSDLLKTDTEIDLTERISEGYPIELSFQGQLKAKQRRALNEILKHDTGVVSAPTGFGKTVLAAKLIAEREVSTLIIVHSKVLAQQWKERLSQFLSIESQPFKEYTPTGRLRKKESIGEIYGSKNKQSRIIDIVLFQTLSSRGHLDEFFNHYGQVIVDEAHHVAAKSYEDVIKQVNTRYLYGLTATPERKDGLHPLVFMRLGDIIYEHDTNIDDSVLIPRYFYPRFTSYSDYNPELNHIEHLNTMQKDEERNLQIIEDICENIENNYTCLVLTDRIHHIEILAEMLEERDLEAGIYTLHSQQAKQENNVYLEEMKNSDQPMVIISTGKFVGEGFDLSQIESLFLCMPFSNKNLAKQYLGRLNRSLDLKEELRVYDYIDFAVDMYRSMYQKRLREYLKLGYVLAEDEKTRRNQIQLYNYQDYDNPLKVDLSQADEIILGLPTLNLNVLEELSRIKQSAKKIIIILSQKNQSIKNQYLLKKLIELDIEVKWRNITSQNFIVCDQRIVWYGNLDFFSNENDDATSIRLINRMIAKQLLN